jgi:DNA-binding transcriptional ArsR family regulator
MSRDVTSRVFLALADPTRRQIVELLATEERMRVSDLASRFETSRQAVTKHLDSLCEAGIVSTERQGRERVATLERNGCGPARGWLDRYDRFWERKLHDLKTQIERGRRRHR